MNLDAPTRARLPVWTLPRLADLRSRADLEVLAQGDFLWLRWQSEPETITLRLLSMPEVELFERRDQQWYPAGRLLPATGVPEDRQAGWKALAAVLFPERIEPLREPLAAWDTVRLRLGSSTEPRPTTALRADFEVVLAWGESAPAVDLQAQRAVWTRTEVLLVGPALPRIEPARRYHGERILCPLGLDVEPALPLPALVEILGLRSGEWALIDEEGIEIVDETRLRPLTRAALRRAAVLRLED